MRDAINALWFIIGFSLIFIIIPAICLAGSTATADSTANANALGIGVGGAQQQQQQSSQVANPSASIQQTFEGTKVPAGIYRQDPGIIIQGNATMPAFFGPFVPGWKVLDDLSSITKLTKSEATMLGGGAKCLLKLRSIVKWETEQVNILPQYDRKIMPDPVGYIFCTASGETTIDIIADAAKLAMSAGGTEIVLLKHKVEYSTSGWGIFLNGGYTHGQISGSEKENTTNVGGVGGTGYGKTKGNSDDGLIFGILRR